jgi:hypothetical protein
MPDARRVFSTLVSLSWMGSKIIIQTSFGCPASSPIGAIPSLGLRSFLLIHRTQCTHISSSLSLSALSLRGKQAREEIDVSSLSLSALSLSLYGKQAGQEIDVSSISLSSLSLSLLWFWFTRLSLFFLCFKCSVDFSSLACSMRGIADMPPTYWTRWGLSSSLTK